MTSYDDLSATVQNLFSQVIDILSDIGDITNEDSLHVSIPTGKEIETMDKAALAVLVARTSNVYSKAARLSGISRAEYKLAQEAYKRKFRTNKVGKNEAEREASATNATEEESQRATMAEAVLAAAEGIESAARVASESARKIMDKLDNISAGESREQTGYDRAHQEQEQRPNFEF